MGFFFSFSGFPSQNCWNHKCFRLLGALSHPGSSRLAALGPAVLKTTQTELPHSETEKLRDLTWATLPDILLGSWYKKQCFENAQFLHADSYRPRSAKLAASTCVNCFPESMLCFGNIIGKKKKNLKTSKEWRSLECGKLHIQISVSSPFEILWSL